MSIFEIILVANMCFPAVDCDENYIDLFKGQEVKSQVTNEERLELYLPYLNETLNNLKK